VAGPVGIYQITGQVVQFGLIPTLRFLGILSVNLAVLNILPLPALDGGRLAFILWEGLTGKKVKAGVEHWIHSVGMAVLLFILVMVTLNDLLRLFGNSWLFSSLKNLLPK
jgi:regulator of sigma E protease